MRQLSFRVAQSCEWAIEERCRCRCGGKAHGRQRGLVAELRHTDPHHVPDELVTLAELKRFYVVKLEPRQGKLRSDSEN